MSARHVAQYWFLHALNSNVPALRHFLLCQHAHPQELFREMSRLGRSAVHFRTRSASAFAAPPTITGISTPASRALDDHIRRHLEIVMPSKAIKIPLHAVETLPLQRRSKRRALPRRRAGGSSRSSRRIGEADLIRQRAQADQGVFGALRGRAYQARSSRAGAQSPAGATGADCGAGREPVFLDPAHRPVAGSTSCRPARWESTSLPRSPSPAQPDRPPRRITDFLTSNEQGCDTPCYLGVIFPMTR